MEEETVRWMMPTGATILHVPKFDKQRTVTHHDRDVRKRERRVRMEEWRQIIRDTRMSILSEESAREQLVAAFQGMMARESSSITSYLDGTRHLQNEIERYNLSLRDRIKQVLTANGEKAARIERNGSSTDILDHPVDLPNKYASPEDVKQYNDIALAHCKEIYIAHPFTRVLDIYDDFQ